MKLYTVHGILGGWFGVKGVVPTGFQRIVHRTRGTFKFSRELNEAGSFRQVFFFFFFF